MRKGNSNFSNFYKVCILKKNFCNENGNQE